MANYTITRHTEAAHIYGCTNFSTIQEPGQIASEIAGSPLDASMVWDIKASSGYVVPLANFTIPNTIPASGFVPTATEKVLVSPISGTSGLPSIVLGAHMEQISSILIRITFWLKGNSNYGISGSTFTMPNSDVNEVITIQGCADVSGEPLHLRIIKPDDQIIAEGGAIEGTTTTIDIPTDKQDYIVHNEINSKTDQVYGTLASTNIDDEALTENLVMKYTVTATDGYRYRSIPSLNFNSKDYYYTTNVTKVDNQTIEGKKDIVSVEFNIYKTL